MDEKFEITLHSRNGNYNGESFKDINLNVYENIHDINIKTFSFSSRITSPKYNADINWCINYLLLEIYNGVRILCGFIPFLPHEQNTQLKTLRNHMQAYEIINNSNIDLGEPKIREKEFRKVMRVIINDKFLRDLCILIDRVYKRDENSLINYYKIQDFLKTYKDLFKKYHKNYKEENIKLDSLYDEMKKYNRLTNNYLTIGLVARHGLTKDDPTKNDFDEEEILKKAINTVQYLINISNREQGFKFDSLLKKSKYKN